jgi:5-formyltetrahydrofolate cyclo-ligase
MMKQITQVDWGVYKNIHLFLPIVKFNEMDTFSIINYLGEKYPSLQIVIPRINFETMEHIVFDSVQTVLEKNKYDIPEPLGGTLVSAAQIDSVLVPLLAFDKKGHRVGYGKGFYDRFLTQCRPETQKIGLSFFDPVDEITDADAWDVKLNKCICPDKIWEF